MVATAQKRRTLQHMEGVRLRGYFLQLFTYPIEYKGELRKATIPLLVGDDYDLLKRPTTEDVSSYSYLVILGIVGVLAIAFVVLMQLGSGRKFQSRRLAGKAMADKSRSRQAGGAAVPPQDGRSKGGGSQDGGSRDGGAAGRLVGEGASPGEGD
jgi:hypothetical protein